MLEVTGFDWDVGNMTKCQKHGVSLQQIEDVFYSGNYQLLPDVKHSKHEKRMIAIGYLEKRWIFIGFVLREKLIRPVTARYMHKKEVQYYEKEKNTTI